MSVQRPFAVLLTKFSDSGDSYDVDFYRRLFTASGAGSGNVTDYFHEASNGRLDISGTQVFDGLTLDQKRADYVGSGVNQAGRQDLVNWARAKATSEGVPVQDFFGVVILTLPTADVFGQYQSCVLSPDTICLGVAAHEMGHALGLNHSWSITSGTADYMDPFDMMSWAATLNGQHPDYGTTGPLINAVNMRTADWLDPSRVLELDTGTHVVAIRPISREDLDGWLAVEGYRFLVEYRPAVGFDEPLRVPGGVLVHSLRGDRSVLHFGTGGQALLRKGDTFVSSEWPFERRMRLKVLALEPDEAQLEINLIPAEEEPGAGPGIIFGGVDVGAGGWVVINGRIVKVPPREPVLIMLEALMALASAELIEVPANKLTVQLQSLDRIGQAVREEVATLGGG